MKKNHIPKAYKALGSLGHEFYSFINPNGSITYLNFNKHLMLNRPYKNREYMTEMINYAKHKMKMRKQKELLDKEIEK